MSYRTKDPENTIIFISYPARHAEQNGQYICSQWTSGNMTILLYI